jgi:hypothetical protein
VTSWHKDATGRWRPCRSDGDPPGSMYGFDPGTSPNELCRKINHITPEGHREVLLARIDAARREGRGVR